MVCMFLFCLFVLSQSDIGIEASQCVKWSAYEIRSLVEKRYANILVEAHTLESAKVALIQTISTKAFSKEIFSKQLKAIEECSKKLAQEKCQNETVRTTCLQKFYCEIAQQAILHGKQDYFQAILAKIIPNKLTEQGSNGFEQYRLRKGFLWLKKERWLTHATVLQALGAGERYEMIEMLLRKYHEQNKDTLLLSYNFIESDLGCVLGTVIEHRIYPVFDIFQTVVDLQKNVECIKGRKDPRPKALLCLQGFPCHNVAACHMLSWPSAETHQTQWNEKDQEDIALFKQCIQESCPLYKDVVWQDVSCSTKDVYYDFVDQNLKTLFGVFECSLSHAARTNGCVLCGQGLCIGIPGVWACHRCLKYNFFGDKTIKSIGRSSYEKVYNKLDVSRMVFVYQKICQKRSAEVVQWRFEFFIRLFSNVQGC
jgi:hypothetical protein